MKENRYRVKFRVITPVTVGNDINNKYSPLCDFILINDDVCIIDQVKLGELVHKRGLMDEFVGGAGKLNNSQTRFELRNFIENRLGVKVNDLITSKIPLKATNINRRKIEIIPMLESAQRPIIPGSSIKGAIKSAILYYWLCNSVNGKLETDRIIKKISDDYKINRKLVDLLENTTHEIDKLKGKIRNEGRDSGLKKNLIIQKKNLEIKQKSLQNELNGKLKYLISILDSLIRRLLESKEIKDEKGFDFRHLRISDSLPLMINYRIICEIKRLHLIKGNYSIPQFHEALSPGAQTEANIEIIPEFRDPELSFMNGSNIQPLLDMINKFSKASIEHEWQVMDDHAENFSRNPDVYNDLFSFYEDFSPLIGKKSGTANMRLGFGKSFFDNSLGLAVYQADKDVFYQYVRLFRLGKPMQKEFPVTRAFCSNPVRPLGWLELSIS
ncbi:MAG: type III-A CRISPR-associated RAMP protein Csm5 [Candidatus Methanofastidiosa archaeon]|nr:type III-A CRISPR-associated RAMP protein Csm5 [Candidatus Methanofastidiosa archaeon]